MKNCCVDNQVILVEQWATPVDEPAARGFGLMKNPAADILVELLSVTLERLKSPLVTEEETKGVLASPGSRFRLLG